MEGTFKDGFFHGQGMKVTKEGKVLVGQFEKTQLVVARTENNSPRNSLENIKFSSNTSESGIPRSKMSSMLALQLSCEKLKHGGNLPELPDLLIRRRELLLSPRHYKDTKLKKNKMSLLMKLPSVNKNERGRGVDFF